MNVMDDFGEMRAGIFSSEFAIFDNKKSNQNLKLPGFAGIKPA